MRGHVRRRGSTWSVVVDSGRDADGRRRQKWTGGFRTKDEAEDALVTILGQLQRGETITQIRRCSPSTSGATCSPERANSPRSP